MEPRHSPTWLAWTLHIELDTLKSIAAEPERHYREFEITTASGKVRPIADPHDTLKRIQKEIVKQILRQVDLPSCVQGSIRGHSPYTNAKAHRGQPVIVRIDIQDFFPSVTNKKVYGIWSDVFGYGRALASLLTQLTTLKGHLPQGTPTSSYLANLALLRADAKIEALARAHGLRYTRFVDDLILSGVRAREVITAVVREVSRSGFTCNRGKLVVAGPTKQRKVTGFTIDRVSVARGDRDRIRAAIRELSRRVAAGHDVSRALLSIQGRVAHVARTNPGAAVRLKKQLAAALASTLA